MNSCALVFQSLVLGQQQVRDYQLPRTPISDSELRKGTFEDVHGAGAVELDALEALYPGELQKIVTEALDEYHDRDAEAEMRQAEQRLRRAIRSKTQEILEPYRAQLEALQEPLRQLERDINQDLAAIEIDIDDYLPEIDQQNVSSSVNSLFDSTRTYLEQLAVYKQYDSGELNPGAERAE